MTIRVPRSALLLSAALLSAAGCRATSHDLFEDTGLLLAEKQTNEGERVAFRLYPGHDENKPTINRTVTRTYEKPKLVDLVVSDLNTDLAKRIGTQAWNGVYVAQIGKSSSAAKGGLVQEDVILEIDGIALSNVQQFHEVVGPVLESKPSVALKIRRGGGGSGEVFEVQVVPEMVKGTETKTDTFELETSRGVQSLTGMQLGVVPPELASQIYGAPENVTIVTGVVTGSPAYFSGFRRGDRVVSVDGASAPDLDRIRAAVHARAQDIRLNRNEMDVARVQPAPAGAESEVVLAVDGPLGPHHGDLAVESDLFQETEFKFPILFDFNSTHDRTHWSFLDFILQFGANYRGEYEPSSTRAVQKSTSLSIFPFGMFEFDRGPTGNAYTFFWFIDFKTSR
jgi:hypothetical protein